MKSQSISRTAQQKGIKTMKKKSIFSGMDFATFCDRVDLSEIEYVLIYNDEAYEFTEDMVFSPYTEKWYDEDVFDDMIIEDVFKVNEMYYIEFRSGKSLPEAEFIDDREELGMWEGL